MNNPINNGNSVFTAENYKITFAPELKATKVITYIIVDGYCQRTSNEFDDGINRRLFLQGKDVNVITKYYNDKNIPIRFSDSIDVLIENRNWTNDSMRNKRGSDTIYVTVKDYTHFNLE